VLEAMIELEAWLTSHSDLNDGIAEPKLVANADIALGEVRGCDILAKGTNVKLGSALGDLCLPAFVVTRVVLMDSIVGVPVRRELTLIASKAESGQADLTLARLFVDGRGDLDTSEGSHFSCSQT
jgi:hypothetical protein